MSLRRLAFALVLLLLSACASAPRGGPAADAGPVAPAPAPAPTPSPLCVDCGVVEKIDTVTEAAGQPSSRPVLGGIVGGVVSSKPAETRPPTAVHLISLRLDDGRRLQIRQTTISPNLRVGSRVRVVSGRVILLR